MRRLGSTSDATRQADAAAMRRHGQGHGARRSRGGRLYLGTALVGVGLCLMQAPALAETVFLHEDFMGDGANISLRDSTSASYRFWRTEGSNAKTNFSNGDTLLLHAYGTSGMTLTINGNVRPIEIRVQSSEYTITGTSPAALQGQSNFQPLRFSFEGTDNVLTVDAPMAGAIIVGRSGGAAGSGGRLVYDGDSEVTQVRVLDGTTLAVTGNLTGTGANGFRLGSDSALDIDGTASGDVTRDAGGSSNTTLLVTGALTGNVTGLSLVSVGPGGQILGTVEAEGAGTVALTGAPGNAATVGKLAGTGIVTIEGDVTATGIAGTGVEIGTGGQFHGVNGGGTLTTAGIFDSAGIIGSTDLGDGLTGITAGLIRLTGGSVIGDVALDGALEVGGLGPVTVRLDGNDVLRGSLDVKEGGVVEVADLPGGYDANGAAITVAATGSLLLETVHDVASLNSAGMVEVVTGRQLTAGTVTLTGGDAVINGTLASNAPVALQGGTLSVAGTLAADLEASGGLLKLTGTAQDVTLSTDAELAGTVGALLLEASAPLPAPPYQVVTTGDLEAASVTQKGGVFTIAAGTTLTSASTLRVEGGEMVVQGSVGALNVTQQGNLVLDGGSAGTLINRGNARLQGTMDGIDNRNLGIVTVTGALDITAGGTVENQGTLTIADIGVLSLTGTLDNSGGTAVIEGELAGNIAHGTVTITDSGTVTGDVDASGTVTSAGGIAGTLTVSGQATVSGQVGHLQGVTGGTVTMADAGPGVDLALGRLSNAGATMDVAADARVTVSGGVAANTSGALTIAGDLDVTGATFNQLTNAGTLHIVADGRLTGGLSHTAGSATLDEGGTITGMITATGGSVTLNGVAGGTVSVGGASVAIGGTGHVTGGVTVLSGSLQNGGEIAGALSVMSGNATVTGSVAGLTTNVGGILTVTDGGALDGGLTMLGASARTTIAASGSVTGTVLVSAGELTSAGTITGNLTNDAVVTLSGSVTGTLSGSGATGTGGDLALGAVSLTGSGSLTVNAGDVVTLGGAATLAGNAQLLVDGGRLEGDVVLAAAGTVLDLGNGGTLDGDLSNGGTANLSGTITGTLSGTGTATTTGNLALGALSLSGSGSLAVNAGHVVTLDGAGTLAGNAQLLVDGGRLAGDVVLADAGTVLGLANGGTLDGDVTSHGIVNLASGATITGTLENHGSVLGGAGMAAVVTISGDLDNYGAINAGAGGTLVINVAGYYENFGGALGSGVTILGNVRNSVVWLIDEDFAITAGNLLNAATGDMTLEADLSLSGNNLTNAGIIAVNGTGSISDTGVLTNENVLTIAAGGSIAAGLLVNAGGTLDNAGLLTGNVENRGGTFTSTGTIAGTFTNTADATLSGDVAAVVNGNGGALLVAAGTVLTAGTISNGSGGQMVLSGTLVTTELHNGTGGHLTSTGTLSGALRNEGTAVLSGLAGAVLNQGGNISLGGDLAVASLTNRGTMAVGSGRALTLGSALVNDAGGDLDVAGTVSGGVRNAGAMTVQTSGTVDEVVNASGGSLTLRGAITGLLDNRAGGEVSVTATAASAAAVDNQGMMRVGAAGNLSVAGAIDNGGSLTVTGAITMAQLHNTGTLTSRGSMTGAVVNSGSAQISGTVTGSYVNLDGTTDVVGNLTMAGPMQVQGGMLAVKSSGRMVTTSPVTVHADGRMRVAGGVTGDIVTAGHFVSLAASQIEGTLVNSGTAQLAGHLDRLENLAGGTVFVHGGLHVDALDSQGGLTVGAGRVMTVTTGTVSGKTVVAGTLSGGVVNQGQLVARGTVGGLLNDVGARVDLAGGTLAGATNLGEVRVTSTATIGSGGLVNDGTLRLMGSARLGIDSVIHNDSGGEMIVAAAAHATGLIVNDGDLTSRGTLAGMLENNNIARLGGTAGEVVNGGSLQTLGTLTVGNLTNNAALLVKSGSVLESGNVLVTGAGGTSTVRGTLRARMQVEAGGMLVGSGRLTDTVAVAGEARLSGRAADVVTEGSGLLRVTGDLDMRALSNGARTIVALGQTLTASAIENLDGGVMTVLGRVEGDIHNAGQLLGSTTATAGTISGNVILRPTGSITGNLDIEGRLIIGMMQLRGVSGFISTLALDPDSVIEEGAVVVLSDGAYVQPAGSLIVRGRLVADTENDGILNIAETGRVEGNILTSNQFTLAGTVAGNVTYANGSMSFAPTGLIEGDLVLAADHDFASGGQVRATRLLVNEGRVMGLAAPGTLSLDGALVNDGVLGLDNDSIGDVVAVAGGLAGNGIYRLDTDISAGTADRVDVSGGPVSGVLTFDLRDTGTAEPDFGQKATLLSWDTAFPVANSYSLGAPIGLPTATERVVYLVVADDTAGEIQLVSAANPAVGAISGNVVLTQSLIGTVINRPSSPYTTGIGFEADRACRMGSWGRAVGGTADASGATRGATLPNGQRISVESQIDASYHGFQVGTDLGCYDGRFADWTLVGGAILGMNSGSTSQPVYSVDPITGRATSELTSVTDADFDQKYAGVYLSAMKDSWVLDLQLRREWTDFTLNNIPQPGRLGLQLTDARFDSRATTLSGSVGYSMPLGGPDSGWSLTPTAGFAWTRTSTDTIVFDDNSTLALEDSETRIGFVGAGVSRTRLAGDGRSATSLFASGTWYKDFASATDSTFTLMQSDGTTSVQPLSSDNLGSFGEISLGASYVRLMDGSGPIKQLNATIRVDGRSGSSLDSYGVTGQIRLQF